MTKRNRRTQTVKRILNIIEEWLNNSQKISDECKLYIMTKLKELINQISNYNLLILESDNYSFFKEQCYLWREEFYKCFVTISKNY